MGHKHSEPKRSPLRDRKMQEEEGCETMNWREELDERMFWRLWEAFLWEELRGRD